jgi:hypothetical protein
MMDSRPRDSGEIDSYRVWLRPMGQNWKIAVENGQGAKWLTRRLEQHGIETTDLVQSSDDLHCTFRCVTTTQRERGVIEGLLIQWPEVELQHSPEYVAASSVHQLAEKLLDEPLHRPAEPKNIQVEIDPFKVWIRPLGNAWKLRVAGHQGCEWLRRELTHRQLECTVPLGIAETDLIVFRCMSETPQESSYVWNLLRALPQVLLQNDPA